MRTCGELAESMRVLVAPEDSTGSERRESIEDSAPGGKDLSCKSFRMRTCKRLSKQRTSTPFRMNTYEKQGGRGVPLLSTVPVPRFLANAAPLLAGSPTTNPASSPFFSHSSALFCAQQDRNPFPFMRFRTLCCKTPGWGYPPHHFASPTGKPRQVLLSSTCSGTGLYPDVWERHRRPT